MALWKFEGENNRLGKLEISAAGGKTEVARGKEKVTLSELEHREQTGPAMKICIWGVTVDFRESL